MILALYFSDKLMKIKNLLSAKYLIVYLYGVFILNVISIFYMDRANNLLNDNIEFFATLILPAFIALAFVIKSSKLSTKQITLASLGLIFGGSLVFFLHVALTL